jgi:hypothetical protein
MHDTAKHDRLVASPDASVVGMRREGLLDGTVTRAGKRRRERPSTFALARANTVVWRLPGRLAGFSARASQV